ncbi:MAG: putative ABC transporter permease [Clostridiales bacterium]|nr:putative ABC transporter permease [Clostridiales bacterium]
MNFFLKLAFLFCIGSLLGWCIEVLFRRFFSAKKWINPGFLVGPYLPLYGFSLCTLYLLSMLEEFIPISFPVLRKLVLFAVMALCVTAIEYVTGLIFIKRLKIKLWDYSDCWGNVDGIICPLFTFFWALLSAAYYFLIHPHILGALEWLAQNLAFSFFIGVFYGVFAIDLVHSTRFLAVIRRFADDKKIVVRYEELKEHISEKLRQDRVRGRAKLKDFFAVYSVPPLGEHLKSYYEKVMKNIEDRRSGNKKKK